MGLNRTFDMDCDKCGEWLADNQGVVTGSKMYVEEKADMAGWKYLDINGWHCAVCLTPPNQDQEAK